MKNGKDLTKGGAKYNIGPVITGIGIAVVANSLAAIKKLVFEEKSVTMAEILDAINNNWEGYDELRARVQAAPKYGNDDDYVDDIAREIGNFFYQEVHKYKDINGNHFLSAFMGISNYLPTGKVLGPHRMAERQQNPFPKAYPLM